MERRSGFNWGYFLLGILFVIVSVMSYNSPQSSLVAIVYIFAFSAIMKGIFELFFRRKVHALTGQSNTAVIIIGIFDLLVGIFLLFNTGAGVLALPFVFAIWFIVDSIFGIFTASMFKTSHNGYYWFDVIISILGIILGIMLLFNPVVSALTLAFLVGFYFMMMGIFLIVFAFSD